LGRCLGALAPVVDELIIVDNASTDSSREVVRSAAPNARLIELDSNRGFGAANNVAMRLARSRYFLLVNPDAWPVSDAVNTLVACAEENPHLAIVGPRLVTEDGTAQRSVFGYPHTALSLAAFAGFPALISGIYAGWRWVLARAGSAARTATADLVEIERAEFLSGAALLVSARAVLDVGEFDERLFLFSEEADLCFRMRQARWSIGFCPRARFVHVGAASSPVSQDWRYAELLRSYLLLLAKRRGLRPAERARRLLIAVLLARAALTPGNRGDHIKQAAARLRARNVLSPMA
jgi:GT2 family glycosyltransferase